MTITDDVMRFKKMTKAFPLLTIEEEKQLAAIIRKFKGGKQKQAAREALMNANYRLVLKYAHKYFNTYADGQPSEVTLMDLVNSGCIGLAKAVDAYNPRKFKTKFSTLAVPWIRQSILSFLYQDNRRVHIPNHIALELRKLKRTQEIAEEVSDKELIKKLNVTQKTLNRIKGAHVSTFSLDRMYAGGESEPASTSLPDTKVLQADDNADASERGKMLHRAIKKLSEMERDIVISQYLSDSKVKLATLGKRWKISGERVRQKRNQAVDKLRWIVKKELGQAV